MKPALSARMVTKAQAAMTSAVEVYNRPSFAYREETFAILALNAWELLLKAKVVKEGGNKARAIWAFENKTLKSGQKSKKASVIKNRTGNPMTIGIKGCMNTLIEKKKPLDADIAANIEALTAIRDNATHYFSASPNLAKRTSELSGATVRNFVNVARDWFGLDFTKHFSLGLPLAFVSGKIETVVTGGEKKLVDYLDTLIGTQSTSAEFAVALRLEMKFEKAASADAVKVQWSKDPDAVKVNLSEEDVLQNFPWEYRELTDRLKSRYDDFIENPVYHAHRKPLELNPKLAKVRLLNPKNAKSGRKVYYNPNILAEFDKHYTKAKA